MSQVTPDFSHSEIRFQWRYSATKSCCDALYL
jgi:hypothetical protein